MKGGTEAQLQLIQQLETSVEEAKVVEGLMAGAQ